MKLSVLGATGSIGLQTLNVVRTLPDAQVTALTGYNNVAELAKLVDEFKPEMVWVPDGDKAGELAGLMNNPCEILTNDSGLIACASESGADIVVNALVGGAGLIPTIKAINARVDVALANKESLVTGGQLIMDAAREKGVRITPIDSEHSAIWQCLNGERADKVEKIILTASGGPFRTWTREKIASAPAAMALKHPNWNMGAKITIDSATLMNKGLEYIEAQWLFGSPSIEVVVHPQSIIHSMVQFVDGTVMAQLGMPDMRLPILYAITQGKRVETNFPRLDFLSQKEPLSFEKPDLERFPCLGLALYAAEKGGTLPAVMNFLNEWAVERYLRDEIDFYGISSLIEAAFASYTVREISSPQDIEEAETWALEFAQNRI